MSCRAVPIKPRWSPRWGERCGVEQTEVVTVALDLNGRRSRAVDVEVCALHRRSLEAAEGRGELAEKLAEWGIR